MLGRMPFAPRFVSQTLTADIKLKAVNKIREARKLSHAASMPPAQITLTSAIPNVGGQNFFIFQGRYDATYLPPMIILNGLGTECICFTFVTVSGKTYLIDISISGAQDWNYTLQQGGNVSSATPITAQQGHLLIPFVAAYAYIGLLLIPSLNAGLFGRAELTRMD